MRRAASIASSTTSGVVSDSAGEDAAGVEPPHAVLAEQVLPVDVTGAQLGGRGVAAIGDADRAAHAEAALGEVQSVAHGAADAVVRHPADQRRVDAALQDEVLDQPADVVVGEAR